MRPLYERVVPSVNGVSELTLVGSVYKMGSWCTLNPSGLQSPPSETIPLGVPN